MSSNREIDASDTVAADYRILTCAAQGPVGTDFAAAGDALAALVRAAMADGWQPQGGVATAHPIGGGQPTLMQAMVRRDVSPRRDSGADV